MKTRHGMLIASFCTLLAGAGASAQKAEPTPEPTNRFIEVPVFIEHMPTMTVRVGGDPADPTTPVLRGGGSCDTTVTHSAANFTGGAYTVQAGFSEDEIAAATYNVPAGSFPVRVRSMECIFATQNIAPGTQITAEWTVLIWDGDPRTGSLVESFSSDGVILPHIFLSQAQPGVNVQVVIDPTDLDQVDVFNTTGQNRFSVGFRIDRMNVAFNGCTATAGDGHVQVNAFPTTDNTSSPAGVSAPTLNWLSAIPCALGCPLTLPGPWYNFGEDISLCRPGGDWNIRVQYSDPQCLPDAGACCLDPQGSCFEALEADCVGLGGVFLGIGTSCDGVNCADIPGACCFQGAGCIDLTEAQCNGAGGVFQGVGTECATTTCFPTGACCLTDGTCQGPLSPEDCLASGGVYQGNNSSCTVVDCPDPIGACCFATGFCLELAEAQCVSGNGSWAGAGTTCLDSDFNGTADVCETPEPVCPCDWNDDGSLNDQDFFDFVNNFFGAGSSDYNDDGFENDQDWFDFANCFFSPPVEC